MVAPFEIAHAQYAAPVLQYFARSFDSVLLLTFRKKLFPDTSQDTLLLLAEGKRLTTACDLRFRDCANVGVLPEIRNLNELPISSTKQLPVAALSTGQERLIEYLLPDRARTLYRRLRNSKNVTRLGKLADIGIGYVTGANEFFHVDEQQIREYKIPSSLLKRSVRRGRALTGLCFTERDWYNAMETGQAGYLLHIPPTSEVPRSVRAYLDMGQRSGICKGFKISHRTTWYSVPNVYLPDGFLSYMSGSVPRLVANDARVYAPNSLHIVRLNAGVEISPDTLAALWHTSLSRLSVEIEGHALGGGMLKIEPTEAESVAIALPGPSVNRDELARELDSLARKGDAPQVNQLADQQVLQARMGLSAKDCKILADAARTLTERRYAR